MIAKTYKWARFADANNPGYEVSSHGDARFSALRAKMPDGRTIEEWYQCDIKMYDTGGTDWRRGKGKPPLITYPGDHLYEMYLSLWRLWAIRNIHVIGELRPHTLLTDKFATSSINQARALAQILNEWFV